jgi:hypothetical protein
MDEFFHAGKALSMQIPAKGKNVGIICKTGVPEPAEILHELLPWLRQKGYEAYLDNETAASLNVEGTPRSQIPALADLIGGIGRRRNDAECGEARGRKRCSDTRCEYRGTRISDGCSQG